MTIKNYCPLTEECWKYIPNNTNICYLLYGNGNDNDYTTSVLEYQDEEYMYCTILKKPGFINKIKNIINIITFSYNCKIAKFQIEEFWIQKIKQEIPSTYEETEELGLSMILQNIPNYSMYQTNIEKHESKFSTLNKDMRIMKQNHAQYLRVIIMTFSVLMCCVTYLGVSK
jgi:hypothetical protein